MVMVERIAREGYDTGQSEDEFVIPEIRDYPPSRLRFVHAFVVFTLVLSAGYLTWRVAGGTIDLRVWWVSVPLFVLEAHNALGLALFTTQLWDIRPRRPWRAVSSTPLRVAVLIPTYNEPEEVLLPTVASAVRLEPEHETWVLDDGRRDWVRQLAEELGARYLTRPDNRHAKAGNLNHALRHVDADIVAVLDADQVPLPTFLTHTLGYFDDPEIAVVQTPQFFYNQDSFEHAELAGGRTWYEEGVFYRIIEAGKNRYDAAFWCGTNALVRVAALRQIGGVATESVAEDMHTTIRLHRAGWKTVHHNEVLVLGLAPSTAEQYWIQRHRWAQGAMQIIRIEGPLLRGLRFSQRLSYWATLAAWFDSWRTLLFVLIAPLVLLTGAVPIRAPAWLYGPLFLSAFVSQFVALRLLARGYYPPVLSLIFEMLRLVAVLPATTALLTPRRKAQFRVTPKGAVGRQAPRIPPLLAALLGLNLVALSWFGATLTGLTPLRYSELGAAIGAAVFALMNTGLLLAAIRRIRDPRFWGERRRSYRFPVRLRGHLDGLPVETVDVSLTGALLQASPPVTPPHSVAHPAGQVRPLLLRRFTEQTTPPGQLTAPPQLLVLLPAPGRRLIASVGTQHELALHLPAGTLGLQAVVRSIRIRQSGELLIGIEFLPGQRRTIATLAVALLWRHTSAAATLALEPSSTGVAQPARRE